MTAHLGMVRPGSTLYIPFDTYAGSTGASVTLTGLLVSDIEVYRNGSVTQRASDTGYTLLDTDGIDFDGITGIHGFSIDLSSNATADFFTAGAFYWVVVSAITVDSQTVNFTAATFQIGYPDAVLNTTIATLSTQTSFTLTAGPAEDDALNGCIIVIHDIASSVQLGYALITDYTGSTRTVTLAAGTTFTAAAGDNFSAFKPALLPTVAGRTLDVSTGGEAGIDWANVGSPTTAVNLSATNIDVDQVVASVSGAVGSVTGNVGGNVTGSVGTVNALAANVITAASMAADASAEIADAVWDEDATGHQTQGTFGQAIGDPVADSDTIWGLVNTNLNATVSSRASQTSLDTLDDFVDTEIAAIITTLGTPAGASISADIAAIEAQTDDIGVAGAGLTAIPWNASWDAEVQSEVTDALVAASLTSLVLATGTADSGSTTTMVDAARTEADNDYWKGRLLVFTSGNIAGQCAIVTDFVAASDTFTFAPPLTQAVSTQTYIILPGMSVWDDTLAEHLISGSTGAALNAAGSAGDPWATALPGAYGAGTAGFIIGTNLDATVSSRLATAGYTAPDNASITTILSDTNDIQTRLPSALVSGRMDSSVGAMAANVITAAATAADYVTEVQSGLATSAALSTVSGLVDDLETRLTATRAGYLDNLSGGAVALQSSVDSLEAGVIVTTNNDKTGYALTSGERTSIATALLTLDLSTITGEAARSVLNAVRFLRNKWSLAAGTLTVTKEDDTTTAWTAAVTTDASADPVTGSDPT